MISIDARVGETICYLRRVMEDVDDYHEYDYSLGVWDTAKEALQLLGGPLVDCKAKDCPVCQP
jgi:hypothetical protein